VAQADTPEGVTMVHNALMKLMEDPFKYHIAAIENSMGSKLTLMFWVFLLTICFNVSGQISAMYNDQGVLIADTNYRLKDKSVFPVMAGSNTEFQYKILTRLNFPTLMMDAGFGGLVVFEVKIEKDTSIKNLYNWSVYKVSSIRIVSDEEPVWGHKEMLEDMSFLRRESFFLNPESPDISLYYFHIAVSFESVPSKQHRFEKYFEDGVFIYKGYLN
jgi:hypothetical protein